MMAVNDEILMAYIDGELDPIEAGRVEQALAGDADLALRLEVQKRLRARLAAHYDPTIEEALPGRFRALLDTNVVAFDAARARRVRPVWQSVAALAATLVLGLFVGRTLPGGEPVAVEGDVMIARGALAETLDTQLASAQPPGAATRIGISFARADGRLCRTFESAAMAGLACRGDAGWQLMMTSAGRGAGPTEYRQAGSGAVLAAAQEMMAGEPLDAAAERRARDSGWRRVR